MRRSIYIVCLCFLALRATAVPARREGFVRTGADGKEHTVYLHGNEYFHYMTDAEGVWLDETTLAPLSEEQKNARIQAGTQAAVHRAPRQQTGVGDQPNIAPRGLVILVSFSDVTFSTPRDTMDNMLNGAHYSRKYQYWNSDKKRVQVTASGSARQYFQDQSYGAYNPVFDVVGPVSVSKGYAYYGANGSDGTIDLNAHEMVQEACAKAANAGADFSQYDNDHDGYVDFVYLIYAGFGEADGGGENTIWPHQSDVSYYGYKHNGKYIGRYACGSEKNNISKVYDGIGTFCHEFSHVLGLPDLYETNRELQGLHTLFDWDVLDYGCYNNDSNTPPAYSAYERFYMGWLTPRLLSAPEYVTLHPMNEGQGESLMISTANTHNMVGWDPNPEKFYLLEVRKKEGWDKHLPGEGMLITKISFNQYRWQSNAVNCSTRYMGVDILEAQANSSRAGSETDAYPAGATEWTAYSRHEVTSITRTASDGCVRFSYRGAPGPAAIEEVESEKARWTKIIRDGQLVIVRDEKEYTVLGNRL